MVKNTLITFIAVFIFCPTVYATDLIVSPSGTGASCISGSPCAIDTAIAAAQPGDTIRLLAGTYVGPVNFPRAGTMDNPIKLVSDGLARSAVIDCQDALVNCVEINYSNIVVDGLEVKNAGYNGIKVDGDLRGSYDAAQSYGRYAGNSSRYNYANGADNIIIQNNYVHHIGYDGIKISHTNNALVYNNEVYKTGTVHFTSSNMWQQGIDAVGVYNSVIRGNYVHDDQVNPIMAHGMFVKGGSENVLIENNIVENIVSPYAAIEVGGDTEWYNTRYTPANVPGLNDRILTQDYNNNEVDMSGTYASATTYTNQYMSEARNCVVRGNLVKNADPPLSLRNAYNTKLYNNTVINSGWSQGWVKLWNDGNKYHRTEQTKLLNNLFFNNTVAVINLGVVGRAYMFKDSAATNEVDLSSDYGQYYNMGYTWFSTNLIVTTDTHSFYNSNPNFDGTYHPNDAKIGANLRSLGVLATDGTWTDRDGIVRPTSNEISNGYIIGALLPSDGSNVIPGVCGSSNGLALSSAPITGLCTAGTASTVTGTGPWSWTCAGSGGGSTASCGATMLETPPTGNASALVACPVIAGFR